MYLQPEHKEIGKENFHAAVASEALPGCRSLIEVTVKEELASGKGLGAKYFGYGTVDTPLKVAVLGTGDEGSVLIGAINPDYIDVKAIADIRPYNVWRAFNGDWYSSTAHAVRCGLCAKYGHVDENGLPDEAKAREAIEVFGDYMEVIEAKKAGKLDIEAVIIALPLHLHAPAAIAAMRADLHVLTEKLMGQTVAACKEMARVAKETKKHLVTGHQRHYNILYAQAVKMMEEGVLGDIHFIRAQWHRGNLPGSDSWQQPMPTSVKPEDAQAHKLEEDLKAWKKKLDGLEAGLKKREDTLAVVRERLETAKAKGDDKGIAHWTSEEKKWAAEVRKVGAETWPWRMKVAQKAAQVSDEKIDASKHGYKDDVFTDGEGNTYSRPAMEELIRWRLWNRTGGGLMAELGSHQLDASSIFLAAVNGGVKQHPLSVEAAAARSLFPIDREVDDHVFCLFEYPIPEKYDEDDPVDKLKKVTVQYASINGNGFDEYGETVYGTDGTLVLEKEKSPYLFRLAETLSKTKVVLNRDKKPTLVTDDAGDEASAAMGLLGTTAMDISRGYTEEEEHWVYCIRENPEAKEDGPQPRCTPKVALGDAVIALATNLSAREGKRIEFDEKWFDPDEDATPELLFVDGDDAEAVKLFTPDVDKYPS